MSLLEHIRSTSSQSISLSVRAGLCCVSSSGTCTKRSKDTIVPLFDRFAEYSVPSDVCLLIFYSAVVVHSRSRARIRRTISFLIISTVSFAVGGYLAISYSAPYLPPWLLGSMPTDEETLSLYEASDDFSREVDEHIKDCALARQLRADPNLTESRPHLKIAEAIRAHNLTGGTLAGPGMIVVPPYYWNDRRGESMVSIFYLGKDVSGHPGMVHGGLLATLLDEGLARCCFPALPNKVGVTASLQVSYKKPTRAEQYLVLRAKTVKVEGRKAWVEGWIEALEVAEGEVPERLVEGSALFIEPKHAAVCPISSPFNRVDSEIVTLSL